MKNIESRLEHLEQSKNTVTKKYITHDDKKGFITQAYKARGVSQKAANNRNEGLEHICYLLNNPRPNRKIEDYI